MKSRKELGKLFQSVYQTGVGVEVGCEQGYNAVNILQDWDGRLVCVDIWRDKNNFLREFIRNTKGLKAFPFVCDSVAASEIYDVETFDFVYIDDDHSYDGIQRSFNAWFPKVRKGGIISGHDYAPAHHKNDCDGVREFIDEFMKNNPHIEMNFTTDDFYFGEDSRINGNEYQTWWFVKV